MSLERIIQDRLKKLANLKEAQIDPFPQIKFSQTPISQLLADFEKIIKAGQPAQAQGRILALRGHGGLTFLDVVDQSARIQLLAKEDELDQDYENVVCNLDIGDFVQAEGELFLTKTGEKTLKVKQIKLLVKSLRPLPEKRSGLKDIETRHRQPYLDLILNQSVRRVFIKRSEIVAAIRNFLISHNFLEVETPILQPLAGGTNACPFKTHHQALGQDFFLRIAPELYLKRLIVAGFERVFEFAKNFRNEGLDPAHLQEFTMLEFYWAYADYEDLINLTEKMFTDFLSKVFATTQIKYQSTLLDFKTPWPRLKFFDLVKAETGLNLDKLRTEKDLKEAIKDKGLKLDLKNKIGYGAVTDELYKKVIRPKLVQPTVIMDYPKEMIPLAKTKTNEQNKIAVFQLIAGGWELVKAYNELNDPIEQKQRFKEQEALKNLGEKEAHSYDQEFVEALEYGLAPTAGWGMGIDRLCALLLDQPSVREVVFFPMVRKKTNAKVKQ